MPRPPEHIWVAELIISEATRNKVIELHHLEVEDIRDALVCVRGLSGERDRPDRPDRIALRLPWGVQTLKVALYEVDDVFDDVWSLGTAHVDN